MPAERLRPSLVDCFLPLLIGRILFNPKIDRSLPSECWICPRESLVFDVDPRGLADENLCNLEGGDNDSLLSSVSWLRIVLTTISSESGALLGPGNGEASFWIVLLKWLNKEVVLIKILVPNWQLLMKAYQTLETLKSSASHTACFSD